MPMGPNVTAGPMAMPVARSLAVGRIRVFVAGNLINIPFSSRRLQSRPDNGVQYSALDQALRERMSLNQHDW